MKIELSDVFFIKIFLLFSIIFIIAFLILPIMIIGATPILAIIFSYVSATYLKEDRWINEGGKFQDFMIYFFIYNALGFITFGVIMLASIVILAVI